MEKSPVCAAASPEAADRAAPGTSGRRVAGQREDRWKVCLRGSQTPPTPHRLTLHGWPGLPSSHPASSWQKGSENPWTWGTPTQLKTGHSTDIAGHSALQPVPVFTPRMPAVRPLSESRGIGGTWMERPERLREPPGRLSVPKSPMSSEFQSGLTFLQQKQTTEDPWMCKGRL